MQQYDFTAPANSPQQIAAYGTYIKYLSGSNGGGDASLVITPGQKGGSKTILQPGQAMRLGPNAKPVGTWTLANNAGGATITGKVVIGDGQIDDPTIAGTVQVIDGGKARSLAGNVFWGYSFSGPLTGSYSYVQLANPAASGKRLVVAQIALQMGVAVGTSAIAHIHQSTANIGGTQTIPPSKLIGAPGASVAVMYANEASAAPTGYKAMADVYMVGPVFTLVKFTEPLIVPPGYVLGVDGGVTNIGLSANFEFYEEPNT